MGTNGRGRLKPECSGKLGGRSNGLWHPLRGAWRIALLTGAVAVSPADNVNAQPSISLGITVSDGSGSANVTVGPGCTVPYAVTGELSDTSSRGLAGFGFDLAFDGGALEAGRVPTDAPMNAFAMPLGINNGTLGRAEATAFGGTPVRGKLHQCGGVMNTLGDGIETASLPFPTGAPIENVAQPGSPVVLLRGSVQAPLTEGTYTLAISATCVNEAIPAASSDTPCVNDAGCSVVEVCRGHPFASVINLDQNHGGSHLDVLAAPVQVTGALTINVVADGICPYATPLPAPYPHDRPKNRYISFDPNKAANATANVAFRIEVKSIDQGSCSGSDSPPCRYAQGTGINEPGDADCRRCSSTHQPCLSATIDCLPSTQTCDLSGETCSNDDPAAAEGTNIGLIRWVGAENNGRFLAVTEAFREERVGADWPDVIHVGDCEIVPQAVYGIRAVDVATGVQSDELLVSTTERPANGVYAWWADLVGSPTQFCNGDYRQSECTSPGDCGGDPCRLAWAPANGFTNIDDVSAVLQVFNLFSTNQVTPIPAGPMATPAVADITWVDLHGDDGGTPATDPPQGKANLADVQQILLAFQGRPYPYSDPVDCPDAGEWALVGGFAPEGATAGGGMDSPLWGGVFSLVPSADRIEPDQTVTVEVFLDTVENLGTYQVSLEVVGGTAGSLALEGVTINTGRQDYVFNGASAMTGASLNGASLGAALMNPGGWTFEAPAYVGTFTYRASQDAQGMFNVNVIAFPSSFVNRANGSRIDASTEATTAIGCDVECMSDGQCDDGDVCTADMCVEGACTFSPGPPGLACDDGKFCTVGEECDGNGNCAAGTSPCQPGEPGISLQSRTRRRLWGPPARCSDWRPRDRKKLISEILAGVRRFSGFFASARSATGVIT